MLRYQFSLVFRQRNVDRPYSFLRRNGFSHNLAHRIAYDKVKKIGVGHIQKLCRLLNCTPNDMMVWGPKKEADRKPNLALNALLRQHKDVDMVSVIRSLPLGELSTLAQLIGNQKKKR